jgi:steroid delta-isomerase-like uncharacterized protein
MSTEANKAIVRRYLEAVWNERNLALVDEVVAPTLVQHISGVSPGRAGVKHFFTMIGAAFPDARMTIEDVIAEGDRVVWRFTIHATHTGPFQGIPATGKAVTITGMNIARMVGGQIVENWGQQDNLGLLQQLGVVPAPGQGGA